MTSKKTSAVSRRQAIALLGAPALLLLADGVMAQQSATGMTSYDVELIVFRTLSSGSTNEEWSAEGRPDSVTSADGSSGDAQAEAAPLTAPTAIFPPLAPGKLKLTTIADTLRRSKRYQPVAHFGWTQPGYPRNDARFIPVDSLIGSATVGLTGRIALARGRYLHLTLDLALVGEDGQRYVLQQTRRMRSSERHYIDHPKFGVIALITPSEG
ncbi:MAG: CsiV family protein [Steroidobacteraceae bacterium]